ncbi:helix-turn-helix domain-containing protein [Ligilactobacillus faecis]|uniref:helix-turn-helix domain-containing protein n=1 Tax=Ligilactobacillus faecis TaxID=762833 RepID=UPI003F799328
MYGLAGAQYNIIFNLFVPSIFYIAGSNANQLQQAMEGINRSWHEEKELQEASGVSVAPIAKFGRNGNVTIEVLLKICIALDCDISDICEVERN